MADLRTESGPTAMRRLNRKAILVGTELPARSMMFPIVDVFGGPQVSQRLGARIPVA